MDRLTIYDGIGQAELQCCMDCGSGAGPNNENCGLCDKMYPAYAALAAYEDTGLTPEEIIKLNDFEQSQCVKLLAENAQYKNLYEHERNAHEKTIISLQSERDTLKKALELACIEIEDNTGSCPFDMLDVKVMCEKSSDLCCNQLSKCWMDYCIQQAQEENNI